jgi:hypothetical protein
VVAFDLQVLITKGVSVATWGPSKFGALVTRSDKWKMTLDGSKLSITYQGKKRSGEPRKSAIAVTPGIFWSSVQLKVSNENTLTLGGIPNASAAEMKDAIYAAHDALLLEAEKKKQLDKLDTLLAVVRKWRDEVSTSYTSYKDNLIWITHQTVTDWKNSIPSNEKQERSIRKMRQREVLCASWRLTC